MMWIMATSDLVEKLFANKRAQQQAEEEFALDQMNHVDMCNCQRCQDLEAWQDLPWYQKLVARIAAFITYGTN